MDGATLIAIERRRQLEEEGRTSDHDDSHSRGELAMAAACYAAESPIFTTAATRNGDFIFSNAWPWSPEDNKIGKHNRIKQLTIAGALIAAEIDRLNRAGIKS